MITFESRLDLYTFSLNFHQYTRVLYLYSMRYLVVARSKKWTCEVNKFRFSYCWPLKVVTKVM